MDNSAPKPTPLAEGMVRKGGVNKMPSQIRVRPPDPPPFKPMPPTSQENKKP